MIRTWIRIGAVAGLIASFSYPALILIPMPLPAVATMASVFWRVTQYCISRWILFHRAASKNDHASDRCGCKYNSGSPHY